MIKQRVREAQSHQSWQRGTSPPFKIEMRIVVRAIQLVGPAVVALLQSLGTWRVAIPKPAPWF